MARFKMKVALKNMPAARPRVIRRNMAFLGSRGCGGDLIPVQGVHRPAFVLAGERLQ
jgi:hypothetical protein